MTLIDDLRAIVGTANVLVEGDLSGYLVDWRQRYRGCAVAVVRPGSTEEVAAVVSRDASASSFKASARWSHSADSLHRVV